MKVKNSLNKSSIVNSDNSKLKNHHQRKSKIINKENKAVSSESIDRSLVSNNKEDEGDYYTSPSLKAPLESGRGKELLTITVEIGNGQKENIIIFENDDAQQISDEFCNKHGINDELKTIFTNQISENIAQVKEEIANEKSEDKFANTTNLDHFQNLSPPSIEYHAFSDTK